MSRKPKINDARTAGKIRKFKMLEAVLWKKFWGPFQISETTSIIYTVLYMNS